MTEIKNPLEEGKEAPLNFAWQFYVSLDESRNEAKRAYRNNDVRAWWKGINEVYNDAQILFNDKEKAELEGYLKSSLEKVKINVQDSSIGDELNKCYRRLMDIMHRHGMVFPNVQDRGISAYRKKMGLPTNEN